MYIYVYMFVVYIYIYIYIHTCIQKNTYIYIYIYLVFVQNLAEGKCLLTELAERVDYIYIYRERERENWFQCRIWQKGSVYSQNWLKGLTIYIYIYIHTCIHTYIHTYIHICIYIYIYVYIYVQWQQSSSRASALLGCGQRGSTLMGPLQSNEF